MSNFSDLGLSPTILKNLTAIGFETPTSIQEEVIPLMLNTPTDLLALAQTGTGKTAAFGLPILEILDTSKRHPQALILTPTRELCLQVCKELEKFAGKQNRVSLLPVYGGSDIMKQIRTLKKGVHVVVATPGRLRDLIRRKAISLQEIEYFVLDEADEMLNMGFKEEIDDILTHAPEEKCVWLFSATMPKEIRRLANSYMKDPVEIKVGAVDQTNSDIKHHVAHVHRSTQYPALRRFLDFDPDLFALVFTRTRRGAQEVADNLIANGYRADALHGDLSQAQRDRIMKSFRNRRIRILVATDVAARGIDVDDITHVFHFNIPDELAFYTHRSGRTGRAGKTGVSIVMATPSDRGRLQRLSKQVKINFESIHIPTGSEIFQQRIQKRIEKITNSVMPEEIGELKDQIGVLLGDLSKEELIDKLIGFAAGPPLSTYLKVPDLNQKGGGRNGAKAPSRLKGKTKRLFINMGSMDTQKKTDIITFIAEESNISADKIGHFTMHEKHSFFEAEEKASRRIIQAFTHLYLGERPLRVNYDDGPPQRGARKTNRLDRKRKAYGGGRDGGRSRRRR